MRIFSILNLFCKTCFSYCSTILISFEIDFWLYTSGNLLNVFLPSLSLSPLVFLLFHYFSLSPPPSSFSPLLPFLLCPPTVLAFHAHSFSHYPCLMVFHLLQFKSITKSWNVFCTKVLLELLHTSPQILSCFLVMLFVFSHGSLHLTFSLYYQHLGIHNILSFQGILLPNVKHFNPMPLHELNPSYICFFYILPSADQLVLPTFYFVCMVYGEDDLIFVPVWVFILLFFF